MEPNAPQWLTELWEMGSEVPGCDVKRKQPRRAVSVLCNIEHDGETTHGRIHDLNQTTNGICLVLRQEIPVDDMIRILPPDGESGDPITARVVHCTQTIQGYKVGCQIEVGERHPRPMVPRKGVFPLSTSRLPTHRILPGRSRVSGPTPKEGA